MWSPGDESQDATAAKQEVEMVSLPPEKASSSRVRLPEEPPQGQDTQAEASKEELADERAAYTKDMEELESAKAVVDVSNAAMVGDLEETMKASADLVMVTCSETYHAMGSYVKTSLAPGIHHGGRPIYKKSNGEQYLFFSGPAGMWVIGADYHKGKCCLRSNPLEHTWCPSTATSWEIYRQHQWQLDPSISVTSSRSSV